MGITVQLNAGYDAASSTIAASGNIIEKINSNNINAFGLSKGNIEKILNNNYKQFGIIGPLMYINYDDVMTTLDVYDAEILGITSEPIIVKTQEFVNSSDVEGTFNVSITDSVSNTSTNTWSMTETITVTQKISYGLKFGVSGETSMSYSQSFGQGGSESKTYTIGSTSGVTVKLQPGQAIVAELSASRGVLNAKIIYDAFVTGDIVVMSMALPTVKKIAIKDLMEAGNLSNSIKSSENMEVGYYSNSKIEIKKKDGQLMSQYYL